MKMSNLGDREWKEFRIEDLFEIKSGKRLTKSEIKKGDRPFVGASDSNNGITAWCSNENNTLDSNVLGVNYNGSVVENFYHPYECIFSDDVKRFHLKNIEDNKYLCLFLKASILKQKDKYKYAYKFNEKRMRRQTVMLPVNKKGEPDYQFMEQYIVERERAKRQKYLDYAKRQLARIERERERVDSGVAVEWGEFRIGQLFSIRRPQARSEKNYTSGNFPFVASGNVNNGVTRCCQSHDDENLDSGNCITVSPVDGSAFYQKSKFLGRGGAGSSILILYSDKLDELSGLFITQAIHQTCSKYCYGKMGNQDNIVRERILLPVAPSGEPDYVWMRTYTQNVLYDKYQAYLNYSQRLFAIC